MLSRRSFLQGVGTAALASSLSACGETKGGLQVRLLQGSIPPQITGQFRQQVGQSPSLSFKPEPQLKDLLALLEAWQEKSDKKSNLSNWLPDWLPVGQHSAPSRANLLTLGDAWLERAIGGKLLQPLDRQRLANWQQLPQRWQQLVRRNERGELDANGAIWGAPYRWGTVLIAYRRDKFEELGWTPTDWGDLWREDLRERLSMIDQPREIIGLTLKKLGYAYNTADLERIPGLKAALFSLAKQVKFYSSRYYLQPLVLGDTWLAVGWSADILPLVNRNPKIAAVVPQSGTSIWTDLWVKPAGSEETPLGDRWIDFCWQAQVAKQITVFADAASPILLNLPTTDIPKNIRDNPLLFISPEIIDRSDFLLPLPAAAVQQYNDWWRQMRTKSV